MVLVDLLRGQHGGVLRHHHDGQRGDGRSRPPHPAIPGQKHQSVGARVHGLQVPDRRHCARGPVDGEGAVVVRGEAEVHPSVDPTVRVLHLGPEDDGAGGGDGGDVDDVEGVVGPHEERRVVVLVRDLHRHAEDVGVGRVAKVVGQDGQVVVLPRFAVELHAGPNDSRLLHREEARGVVVGQQVVGDLAAVAFVLVDGFDGAHHGAPGLVLQHGQRVAHGQTGLAVVDVHDVQDDPGSGRVLGHAVVHGHDDEVQDLVDLAVEGGLGHDVAVAHHVDQRRHEGADVAQPVRHPPVLPDVGVDGVHPHQNHRPLLLCDVAPVDPPGEDRRVVVDVLHDDAERHRRRQRRRSPEVPAPDADVEAVPLLAVEGPDQRDLVLFVHELLQGEVAPADGAADDPVRSGVRVHHDEVRHYVTRRGALLHQRNVAARDGGQAYAGVVVDHVQDSDVEHGLGFERLGPAVHRLHHQPQGLALQMRQVLHGPDLAGGVVDGEGVGVVVRLAGAEPVPDLHQKKKKKKKKKKTTKK